MGANNEQAVVSIKSLTHRFGRKVAVDDVSFEVHKGQVFGLVGENGAGKTTIIRHILGALKADSGTVHVSGVDPTWDPPAVLSRIGYLSEDRDLPQWMQMERLMRYTQAFYPNWDEAYAERLREQFELPLERKIRHMSRGERARAALLIALAHRPELLLLDEPSSGLDAVARRDMLATVVRSVAEEGRTVVFSSHLLDEVERVSDHVAMIHKGRLVLNMPLDSLKATHHRFVVRFDQDQAAFPEIPCVLRVVGDGCEWDVVCQGDRDFVRSALSGTGGRIVEESVPSLEAIFVARVIGSKNKHAVA